MLYNESTGKPKVQADVLTLSDFIGWLETKDPRQRYEFDDCAGGCLLGQYMAERGIPWGNGNYIPTCKTVFGAGLHVPVLASKPYTFGAALERARKAAQAS
jgi:hypothetical protein